MLANGTTLPDVTVEAPALPPCPWQEPPETDHFDTGRLDSRWQFLRLPLEPTECTLSDSPGNLRLYGGEGLSSRFRQSMVLQRVTEPNGEMETSVVFEPGVFKQMAGLILWYDNDNYLYLHLTHDEQLGKVVTLLTAENKRYAYPAGYIPVARQQAVRLRIRLDHDDAFCAYAVGDDEWHAIGGAIDATALSDEACAEGWFTGTMAGLCCQDLTGARQWADFDFFTYRPERADALERG